MRMRKSKLKTYLHVIGAKDSDVCECGQKETVNTFCWIADVGTIRARAESSGERKEPMRRYVFSVGKTVEAKRSGQGNVSIERQHRGKRT